MKKTKVRGPSMGGLVRKKVLWNCGPEDPQGQSEAGLGVWEDGGSLSEMGRGYR